MKIKKTTGEIITDLIKDSGKSAAEVASELNKQLKKHGSSISKATLSDMCNDDKSKGFSYKYFLALSNYFGVSVDYLLCLTDSATLLNTPEQQMQRIAQDYTGLSDEAIEKLHCNEWTANIIDKCANEIVFSKEFAEARKQGKVTQENLIEYINADKKMAMLISKFKKIASEFICSNYFDEIIASYINEQRLNEYVEMVESCVYTEDNTTYLNPENLDNVKIEFFNTYRTHNFIEQKNLDYYLAQNNAQEFVKKATKYDDNKLRITQGKMLEILNYLKMEVENNGKKES